MTPLQALLIALGGACGALARFAVGQWVTERLHGPAFPWGTFVINVTGSFILGLAATVFVRQPQWRYLINVGFVGAYTTFSTFEYETARIHSSWQAMGNLVGSVLAGYLAVWLGIRLGSLVMAR